MGLEPLISDDGINLDHPLVILFRRVAMELRAKEQNSNIYCPNCKTNLPYTPMTVFRNSDPANLTEEGYFCTLCQKEFHEFTSILDLE